MGKHLAVVALLLAAGAGGFPRQSAAQGSLRYTVELDELRELAQRLELRTPDWRLLAWERGLAPEDLAFGLACPWAAFGPLAPRGLLRALADPLAYAPGSELFEEQAGFRLEGSLEGTARRGLWLEPFPGRLGLFGLRTAEEPGGFLNGALRGPLELLQAGAAARLVWQLQGRSQALASGLLPVGPAAGPLELGTGELEALALLSVPSPPASSPDWLWALPPFPGGKLAHLGARLRLQGAQDRLSCSLLGAASGGERVPPGLFCLGCLGADGRSWSAHGLLGACSPDYRNPEGKLRPEAWAAGLLLELRPGPYWRFNGSWRREGDRPPAVPDRNLPGTEEGKLCARVEAPLAAGGRLEARAEGRIRVEYAADGGAEPSGGGGLQAGLLGERGGLGLELRGGWKEGGGELQGILYGQRAGARLRIGISWEAPGPARPCVRLELAGEAYQFWVSAAGRQNGREVSLGWSVAQPLPKSPTSRISRSRR